MRVRRQRCVTFVDRFVVKTVEETLREGVEQHGRFRRLGRWRGERVILSGGGGFHATGSIDKVQHDVTGNEEKVEMNLPQDSRVAGRNRRCILAPCSGALAAFAWR